MISTSEGIIPSVELKHDDVKVNFAFRTMEEIHQKMGNTKDIPHRHDYYTILWASNACGLHFIDYKEHVMKPNVIFFVNPGQVHQVITYGNPEGFVIMFTREFLHQNMISEEFILNLGLFSDSANTPPLEIDPKLSGALHNHVLNIKETFKSNETYKSDKLGAYLKLFLIESNRFAPTPDISDTQGFQSGKIIVKGFKLLLEQKFAEWHKVNHYANELNITPDYLNNVIKSAIGKTAKEFIQERIILEAKRIGLHTQLSNKEIAYQLGFDDPSHFSKFYKKAEGQSFSEFRNTIEANLT